MKSFAYFLSTLASCSLAVASAADPLPAFPGAAGFGKYAQGARGGTKPEVYIVDSLADDDSPGTLRHAIDSVKGKRGRFIVFRIGGVITLQESRPLVIDSPFITIAGQTAPLGGICIRGEGLEIRDGAHDIIVRGLRVRPSDLHYSVNTAPRNRDAIKVGELAESDPSLRDIIIDHCSFSWGTDETASAYRACQNVTFQYNIIESSLRDSIHEDETAPVEYHNAKHGMGMVIGPWTRNVTLYRNLIAHHEYRNPFLKQTDQSELINNYIYNFGNAGGQLSGSIKVGTHPLKAHVIANYWLGGPDTTTHKDRLVRFNGIDSSSGSKIFLRGNAASFSGYELLPHQDVIEAGFTNAKIKSEAFTSEPAFAGIGMNEITKLSSQLNELDFLLDEVGARWPSRDAIDARLMNDISNRQGSLIDVVYLPPKSQPGKWLNPVGPKAAADIDSDGDPKLPDYASYGLPSAIDADRDGIPDTLETEYGSDPLKDDDGDGYLNIEEYLNDIITGTR
ncbi:hypothetical protein [Pelagicoccus sp. SDUM812005]|uniref:pectate lyase family protein n=1 Tax=Pelagicoccus sp. SDUM812005 TaxID=3041257 RepID=UPI00280FFCD1|nr:hypothetical protein [Pelagicoccus sp. SDUM812005]MDQ8181439.1 hypothetical protein [Pelagicoccus sp. SDUM812005]